MDVTPRLGSGGGNAVLRSIPTCGRNYGRPWPLITEQTIFIHGPGNGGRHALLSENMALTRPIYFSIYPFTTTINANYMSPGPTTTGTCLLDNHNMKMNIEYLLSRTHYTTATNRV